MNAVIAATGVYAPPDSITNDELVGSFNAYVAAFNAEHAETIARGEITALLPSSADFIEKASGVRARHVVDKTGVLDPTIMRPDLMERPDDELSLMAEMAVSAARQAIDRWGKPASDIDAVICAASNMQRAYPAIAIEVQAALGAGGFALDMNVGCSSATFAIKTAADYVSAGTARAVLIVSPEIPSGHLNFRDRDSHFIFGDACTAVIVEAADQATGGWDILGARLKTAYANTIRNNFGFLGRASPAGEGAPDKLFVQQGRKVFKDVVPMVSGLILDHAAELGIEPSGLKRLWLHQANINMNDYVGRKVLGREPGPDENIIILDRYANTASAGSIIAFHERAGGLESGDIGLIFSFGAGYSVGSVFVRKR